MIETDTLVPEKLAGIREQAKMFQAGAWHTLDLRLETITPMLGGGTESGEIDALLPMRPRAIRNQLKHWWWLQSRHRYQKSSDLYKDMVAIWGGPADREGCPAAWVRIQVEARPVSDEQLMPYLPIKTAKRMNGQGLQEFTVSTDLDSPGFYALWGAAPIIRKVKPQDRRAWPAFSLAKQRAYQLSKDEANRERQIGRDPFNPDMRTQAKDMAAIEDLYDEKQPIRSLLLPGYQWGLSIQVHKSLDDVKTKQVRDAIWAWLMLGGYGARSQRGLGRSRLCNLVGDSVFGEISDEWDTSAVWFGELFGNLHAAVPNASRAKAVVAWDWAIGIYKQFRQARQFAENHSRRKQSFGHLANGIRKATGNLGHALPKALAPTGSLARYTPLAESLFGAPIVYVFKQPRADDPLSGQEPADGEVSFSRGEEKFSRYTSPLWVTVARTKDGKFMPVAACLKDHWRDLQGLSADVDGKSIPWGEWWPDLSTPAGVDDATRLLGHEARNPPRPGKQPDWKSNVSPYGHDDLYDDIVKKAVGNTKHPVQGDPIAVFLNFMRDFPD